MTDHDGSVPYQSMACGRSGASQGIICLLISVALERVTFYVVATNLNDFFLDVVDDNDTSGIPATAYLVFTGTAEFLPLFGGILGDSVISSYACTCIGFVIEALGSLFLLALMIVNEWWTVNRAFDLAMVFTGLSLMAIGLGFYRVNILVLGCGQLTKHTDNKVNAKAVEIFFALMYWVTNFGSLTAYIIISVAETVRGMSHKPIWYLGIVQTVAISLSSFFIIVGKRWFKIAAPNGLGMRRLWQALIRKVKYICRCCRMNLFGTDTYDRSERKIEDTVLAQVFRILVVIASIIMFSIIYALEFDIFASQGLKMDTHIGKRNGTIPIQIMRGFDPSTIIIILPVIHLLITPLFKNKNWSVPLLKRMGFGLLFGCASALSAGVVEFVRHKDYLSCSATCFSVFWQIPQFIFIGLGEICVYITGYQFLYLESPAHLKGLVLGLEFCLVGLGTYFARVVLVLVQKVTGTGASSWYPDDFNQGHIAYFLFLLAGLQLFFMPMFIWFASKYKYVHVCVRETTGVTDNAHEREPLCESPVSIRSQGVNSYSSFGTTCSLNSADSLESLRANDR